MGRASIVLVMGLGLLFAIANRNLAGASVSAYENALSYYDAGVVRDAAVAGANMAAWHIFKMPPCQGVYPWWGGFCTAHTIDSIPGATFIVTVDSTSSVDPITGARRLTVRSTATYRDSSYTVRFILRPSSFSKFAVYTGVTASAGSYWATGDSIKGPMHAQGKLKTTGKPWFGGKVTTLSGVDSSSSGHPIFTSGVENGVNVPLSRNFKQLVDSASTTKGGITYTSDSLYLNFQGDSIKYHRGSSSRPDTTAYLPTWCKTKTILLMNSGGSIHVKGKVKGDYTIACIDSVHSTSTYKGAGKVWIDSNIVYNTSPKDSASSTDMLGIVSWNDIWVKKTAATDVTVQASLMSVKGGIQIDQMTTRTLGTMYTYGGWIVETLPSTTDSGITHGLKVNITYDERFRTMSPPNFPSTQAYEILAWYE